MAGGCSMDAWQVAGAWSHAAGGWWGPGSRGSGRRRRSRSPLPPLLRHELLLAILLDVLEDLVGQLQLPVGVAGVRILRVGADGELLLLLPLKDALALGRVVTARHHLLHQRAGLGLVRALTLEQQLDQLVRFDEVVRDHRER